MWCRLWFWRWSVRRKLSHMSTKLFNEWRRVHIFRSGRINELANLALLGLGRTYKLCSGWTLNIIRRRHTDTLEDQNKFLTPVYGITSNHSSTPSFIDAIDYFVCLRIICRGTFLWVPNSLSSSEKSFLPVIVFYQTDAFLVWTMEVGDLSSKSTRTFSSNGVIP